MTDHANQDRPYFKFYRNEKTFIVFSSIQKFPNTTPTECCDPVPFNGIDYHVFAMFENKDTNEREYFVCPCAGEDWIRFYYLVRGFNN